MRKIALFMMTLMMVGSLFAYEPKKENVTVKRNGNIKYYEKTEPYEAYGDWTKDYDDYVCWVIRKGYTVEQCVDYEYKTLERARRGYYFGLNKYMNTNPSEFEISMSKLLNKMNGTNISPEGYARQNGLRYAKKRMDWAITAVVFVTEENFLTLTKEEMLDKMYAFISDCTK